MTLVSDGWLWLTMDMFDFDFPQWLCHNATFILVALCQLPTFMNGYVTLCF
jgi:hypothetical protein